MSDEGLDQVDWSRLTDAYGPALRVPALLRSLADSTVTPERLEHVMSALNGSLLHQGMRTPATAHAVPFVADLLLSGTAAPAVRLFALSFLHAAAVYERHEVFPRLFDSTKAAPIERKCFESVEEQCQKVAQLLYDPDDALALGSLALLSEFPRQAEICAPGLWQMARSPAARGRRGAALVALARLSQPAISETAVQLMELPNAVDALYGACAEIVAQWCGSTRSVSDMANSKLASYPGFILDLECPFAGSLGQLVRRCAQLRPRS